MKHIIRHFVVAFSTILSISVTTAQSFKAEDIRIANPAAGIELAGTLTSPVEGAPKAVIVLATGSGAQNRDEEIMGHKPFKVIAETLSGHGYAVLRMDDRGTGESGGDFACATTDDFCTDIAAGVAEMTKRHPAVKTGILGHSEGGTIAIKEAVNNPECDFIITLGAPAWAGDSIIMSQARAMAVGLMGKWDAETHQREILDLVKSSINDIQLRMALTVKLSEMSGQSATIPQVKEALMKQIDVLASPWYRQTIKYDPASDIIKIKKPWLALNGDRDTQVLPGNLQTIKNLNPGAETMLLEKHNHLFQRCTTGLMNEYAGINEDISEETLAAILLWLDNSIGR
ncbi:S9 family peptidase [uncultured Muribaculum sp.]|jgi:hypothetical protein|uniref:alpha/beta hydrolase family protein n=1 Tax=uncultured Muribaculum sp. TaxID=1918613 RepID=UPI0026EF389C|nr:alpha/beta fold hydrolase [uncultured Muribaculum sp.]